MGIPGSALCSDKNPSVLDRNVLQRRIPPIESCVGFSCVSKKPPNDSPRETLSVLGWCLHNSWQLFCEGDMKLHFTLFFCRHSSWHEKRKKKEEKDLFRTRKYKGCSPGSRLSVLSWRLFWSCALSAYHSVSALLHNRWQMPTLASVLYCVDCREILFRSSVRNQYITVHTSLC